MTDLLISIDGDKPATTQFPVDVRDEIDALFMLVRDGLLVHKAGAETIDGAKTFSSNILSARAMHLVNNLGEATRLRLLHALAAQTFDVSVSAAGSFEIVNVTDSVVPFSVSPDAVSGAVQILPTTVKVTTDLDLDNQDLLNVGNVNVANGFLKLDSNGRIPTAQLTVDAMQWKGTWNAGTNTPTLTDGSGSPGDIYRVTVGGTRNLGSGNQTFDVGDWVVLSATNVWEKADMTDAVNAVVGLTGNITKTQLLQALDVEIGIDVQAYSPDLTTLSTLLAAQAGSTTQLLSYVGSTDTWGVVPSSAWGRSVLAIASADAMNNQLMTGITPSTGTNYGPILTDAQKLITADNAAANTITVPTNTSIAFPIGTTINVMQLGAGQTSFVAAGGVTIRSDTGKLKIATQYAGATLVKIATDTWWLTGSLIA